MITKRLRGARQRATWRVAIVVTLALAACAPAGAPGAPPAPAPPAATAAPGAQPAASAGWQAEWDRTLAAARQEGKVVVVGPPGQLYRDALVEFRKQYPEIALEYSGQSGRDFAPKILAERSAGQYLTDVNIGGAETPNFHLKPVWVLEPIKPALIRPEVLDDSVWLGGFDDGFMDRESRFTYGFQGDLSQHVWVNRDAIPESELSSVEQLLDPRWKGKIAWNDPRAAGAGSAIAGYWLMLKGEDWLRQLYQQDVVVTRDLRQQVEWIVQNRYPITVGGTDVNLREFQQQGIGLQVKTLAFDSELGSRLSPGFGNVMLLNRAPHPNAARIYLDWLLSREGQASWAKFTERNSRRLDVPGPPETAAKPGVSYVVVNKEEHQPNIERAIELAKTVFR